MFQIKKFLNEGQLELFVSEDMVGALTYHCMHCACIDPKQLTELEPGWRSMQIPEERFRQLKDHLELTFPRFTDSDTLWSWP